MLKILKIKTRRIIAQYFSSLIYIILSLKFNVYNFKKKPPVIILTPGKVGSSSVYYTLKNALKYNNVFHIHFLSKIGIENSVNFHLKSDRNSLPMHLLISKLLIKKLKNYKGDLTIVSLVREPVSRSISNFFQNIDFYKDELEDSNLNINETKALSFIDASFEESLNYLENWIDIELYKNLKIDIFKENYAIEDGYAIFKKNNIKLLIFRMEDLNANFKKGTQSFFNLEEGIKLDNFNVGDKKYYSDQYNLIKKKIKIKKDTLDKIFQSKYFSHFYSDFEDNLGSKYNK
jgi:hypothetical protein